MLQVYAHFLSVVIVYTNQFFSKEVAPEFVRASSAHVFSHCSVPPKNPLNQVPD